MSKPALRFGDKPRSGGKTSRSERELSSTRSAPPAIASPEVPRACQNPRCGLGTNRAPSGKPPAFGTRIVPNSQRSARQRLTGGSARVSKPALRFGDKPRSSGKTSRSERELSSTRSVPPAIASPEVPRACQYPRCGLGTNRAPAARLRVRNASCPQLAALRQPLPQRRFRARVKTRAAVWGQTALRRQDFAFGTRVVPNSQRATISRLRGGSMPVPIPLLRFDDKPYYPRTRRSSALAT